MKKKRVIVLADLHCGHVVGLTPPHWQISQGRAEETNLPSDLATTQRVMWGEYVAAVRRLGKVDLLVVNGDCIEGKGWRSGATELLTSDRDEQCEMACQCLNQVDARDMVMTYGTPYHAGANEDWENRIAKDFDCPIGSHEWATVNGVTFDFKHAVGASSIPHGRHTALARDRLWNALWAERGEQPKAQVIVRSHVHYHAGAYDTNWEAVTTPALQAAGTKFGGRKCSGTVDLGFLYFDVYEDKTWQRNTVILGRAVRKAQPTIVL